MKTVLFAVAASLAVFSGFLAAPVWADKPRSIVGRWSLPEEGCGSTETVTTIGALSMSNADVVCTFRSVQRNGNTVRWQGVCDDAEGSSDQTVIATLKNERLTIRYVPGGNEISGLKRCGS